MAKWSNTLLGINCLVYNVCSFGQGFKKRVYVRKEVSAASSVPSSWELKDNLPKINSFDGNL